MNNTTFEEVFKKYMERIISYRLAEMTNEDKIEDMTSKLKTAIGRFQLMFIDCDIEADYKLQEFKRILEPIEIDILSLWMALEWVRPLILSEEKAERYMTTTDYEISSPVNLLNSLKSLQSNLQTEVSSITVLYGYKTKIREKRKRKK